MQTAGLVVRELEVGRSRKAERDSKGQKNATELTHQKSLRQDSNTFITVKTGHNNRSLTSAGSSRLGTEAKTLAYVLSRERRWW